MSSAAEPRVVVVITAYNSAPALRRCLTALAAQTRPVDDVLIVDNSQPDEIDLGVPPKGLCIRVVHTGANLGPAGGFALGLAVFIEETGWSHAWVMDDDVYPAPDALERLLGVAETTRPGHLLFPTVADEMHGTTIQYPAWCGVLMDRTAVVLGGLPNADLFWWIEDTEYLQFRLPRAGVITIKVAGAKTMSNFVRRGGARAPWKYYYETRNSIYFRLRIQGGGLRRVLKLARTLARLGGAAMRGTDRQECLALFARGLVDGVLGRLGRQIEPPVAARSSSGHSSADE